MAVLPPDDPQDVYNRRAFAWASTTVVLVLSIASYVLRLWARKKSGQKLKVDDWLMGAGLLISFIPAICEYVVLANGVGHHIWNVPKNQSYNFIRASFALQRANQPSLVCIKLSILFFYLRLFPGKWFAWAAYANMGYTVAWGIATWIVNLNVCTPVAFFYDKTIPGGVCKDQAISGTISGALSLLGDIFILVLPIPMVWQLQINARRKIALLGIFLLGTIVCVSSAIRIGAVVTFVATDATYTQVYASCWTYMEMGTAVISGNLPLLRPLFEPFFRMRGQTTVQSNGSFPSKLGTSGATAQQSYIARVKVGQKGFERMSDEMTEHQQNGSDVELGDMAILVKTDLTVTTTETKFNDKDSKKNVGS